MADNPIKHSDIIEQGDPFEDMIRGLEKMLRLLKKTAKEHLKFAKAQDVSTKKGKKNIQAVTKATQQLTIKEKEALKIKKQLEQAQAKLALAGSKENKQLIKTREALRAKNAELRNSAKAMRTGVKTTNKWSKALGSFAFKFNALGNMAAMALSRIVSGLGRAIKESITLAAKAEGVTAAFRNLGKPGFLKELQKATRGTVTNLELMQAAVQAKNFKIPLEKLATFFDFATSRAIQTGESVDFLVNSIITGIGRKSVLVMDNLGISAVELQEEIKKVGDFGLASANIIERAMQEAGDVASTTATFIAQINTEWTNLKTNIGGSEVIMFFLRGLKAGFEDISKLLNRDQGVALTQFLEFAESIKDKEPEEQLSVMAGKIKELRSELGQLAKDRRVQQDLIDNGSRVAGRFAKVELEKIDKIQTEQIKLLRIYEDQFTVLKETSELPTDDVKANNLAALKKQLKKLKETRDIVSLSEVSAINREIVALEAKIKKYKETSIEVDNLTDKLISDTFALEDWMNKAFDVPMFLTDIKNGAVDAAKAIDDLANSMINIGRGDQELPDLATKSFEQLKGLQERTEQLFADGIISFETYQSTLTRIQKAKTEKRDDIVAASFDLANRLTSTFTNIFAAQKEKELSAVGDNAKKREEIEKKFAKKEQILSISQAFIDGASSILKTKASLGLPAAIPFMIADAAITAAQIGVIAAQKFGEGEVDIHGPSHSSGGIAAEIEGGESVINKRSTSNYGSLLEAINTNDSAAIADAALNNSAFHEVWGRTRMNESTTNYRDPYTKKMWEAMMNTPTIIPDGPRIERYPNGITRIIKGENSLLEEVLRRIN